MERHQSSGDKILQVAINLQNEMLMLCVRVQLHEEDKPRPMREQSEAVAGQKRNGGVLHN
jgi:hypothetical protein